jgi:nitrogen fixation protein NifB
MTIKINTVLMPGINDHLLYSLGLEIKKRGANIHNIMPVIPQGKLAHIAAPSHELISSSREICGEILPQMKHCQQCRADAIGLL